MRRHRTAPPDASHNQTVFEFYAAMLDAAESAADKPKPLSIPPHLLPIDSAGFEPLPGDVVRIGGFVLHRQHAARLLEVQAARREWIRLDLHVIENCEIYSEGDDEPGGAGM